MWCGARFAVRASASGGKRKPPVVSRGFVEEEGGAEHEQNERGAKELCQQDDGFHRYLVEVDITTGLHLAEAARRPFASKEAGRYLRAFACGGDFGGESVQRGSDLVNITRFDLSARQNLHALSDAERDLDPAVG